MRAVGKLVVSVLSLILLATPIMACVIPAAAMTAAERDCCKRMAQECGKKGIPKSHSCCQTTTVPDHLPAIKSSSDAGSKPVAMVFVHALPTIPSIVGRSRECSFSFRNQELGIRLCQRWQHRAERGRARASGGRSVRCSQGSQGGRTDRHFCKLPN
jgi:hypothetical protein